MDYISGDETVWEKDTVEHLAKQGHMAGLSALRLLVMHGYDGEKNYLEELWRSGEGAMENMDRRSDAAERQIDCRQDCRFCGRNSMGFLSI